MEYSNSRNSGSENDSLGSRLVRRDQLVAFGNGDLSLGASVGADEPQAINLFTSAAPRKSASVCLPA